MDTVSGSNNHHANLTAAIHKEETLKFTKKFNCPQFVFKPVSIDDATVLFDAVRSETFPSFLLLAKIKTLDQDQAEKWCSERVSDWQAGDCFVWTCQRMTDSEIVGQVTLLPQDNRVALAYWIHPERWGQGLATRMCESLLCHIHGAGYRGEVSAGVHAWNDRSAAVLKKLGFTQVDSGDDHMIAFSRTI